MKKLFFTAIAFVAFSGVSMANTIEIEYKFATKLDLECNPNASEVETPCGNFCVTVRVDPTGILEIDILRLNSDGTFSRKPTEKEKKAVSYDLCG